MQTRNIPLIVSTIAMTMLIAAPVWADDFIWSGLGADNLWTNGANWLDGTAPDGDDNAIFNETGTGIVDIGAAVITDSINIQGAADGYEFIGSGSVTGNFNHNATGTNTLGFLINANNNFGISNGPLVIAASGQLMRGDTMYLNGVTINVLDGGVLGGPTGPNRVRVNGSTNTVNVNEGGLFQCLHTFHIDSGTVDYTVDGSMIGPRWEYNGDNKAVTINSTGVGVVTLAGGLKKNGGNGVIEMEVGAALALRGQAAGLTLADFYAMTTGNEGFSGDDFRYGASGIWTNFDDMPGTAWYDLSYDADYNGTGDGYTVLQTVLVPELQSTETGPWGSVDTWSDGVSIPSESVMARVLDTHVVTVDSTGTAVSLTVADGGQVQVTGVLGDGTPVDVINVQGDAGKGGGVLTVQPGGALNAGTLNSAGVTNLTGAAGAVETLNVTGGITTIASPTITQVNASGGMLNTEGAGVTNMNITGAAVSTTAAAEVADLTVTGGSLGLSGGGMTVNTATVLGGSVDASSNAITVISGGGARLNDLAFSNPTHNITLSGSDLGDSGAVHTVTLSGGTTTISGLQGGPMIRDYFDDGDLATGGAAAVNGGFDTYNNFGDETTTTLAEAGGMATLGWTTPPNNFRKMGIVSKGAVDVTGQAGINAAFVIDSVTFPIGELDNMKLGLADLIFTMRTSSDTNLTYSIGLEDVDDRHGYTEVLVSQTNISANKDQFTDGFTLVMEADAAGWKLAFPGTDLDDQTGAWPAGFTFDSVFDDTTLMRNITGDAIRNGTDGATPWVQVMRRGNDPFELNIDSMEVNAFGSAVSNPVTHIVVDSDSTLALSDYPSATVGLSGIEVADAATLDIDAPVTDIKLANLTLGGGSRVEFLEARYWSTERPGTDVNVTVTDTLAAGDGVTNVGYYGFDSWAVNLTLADGAAFDWTFGPGPENHTDVSGELTVDGALNIRLHAGGGTASGEDVALFNTHVYGVTFDPELITIEAPDGWDWDKLPSEAPDIQSVNIMGEWYLVLKNLVTAESDIPGDVDGDGVVDDADVDYFQLFFGLRDAALDAEVLVQQGLGNDLDADFNDDNRVNLVDFDMLMANFPTVPTGPAPAAPDFSQVPEPATMSMLAIGGLLVVRRRRRKAIST